MVLSLVKRVPSPSGMALGWMAIQLQKVFHLSGNAGHPGRISLQTALLTHEELVQRCKSGDRKAQKQLFDLFASSMYRVSYRYLRDEADSEDVLMMAFTRVFANLVNFNNRGDGSLQAWIRRIVVNESLMWLRRRNNYSLVESGETTEVADLNELSILPAEDIARFIHALPDGYRTVFNLSVIEGYDHKEIAEMLGITEGTSRSQLSKARLALKKMLTREGYHYGT